MFRPTAFMGAALALTFATAAPAQTADTVVATVGETEITLGEMILVRSRLPQQYEQSPAEVIFDGILDQLVQQQLLADTLDEVPARVQWALKNEARGLKAGEVLSRVVRDGVTEEMIREAYAARFADAEPTQEWNASHLLVETEEEAQAARDRVEGGEDFADVARDVSTGPTGPNGGNLGWFTSGQMVPEFEAAVVALEPGQVSPPVQTQFGWHIVTLNEVRDRDIPELEQMRAELTAELQSKVVDDYLAELTESVTVTKPEEGAFDPSLLTNFELLEQ